MSPDDDDAFDTRQGKRLGGTAQTLMSLTSHVTKRMNALGRDEQRLDRSRSPAGRLTIRDADSHGDGDGAALELLFVLLGGVMLVNAAWFWAHCASPMLRARHAGPMTTGLLFGVSIFTIVAEAAFIATVVSGHASQFVWFVAGFPWLLMVGLPYLDDYRTLARLGR